VYVSNQGPVMGEKAMAVECVNNRYFSSGHLWIHTHIH